MFIALVICVKLLTFYSNSRMELVAGPERPKMFTQIAPILNNRHTEEHKDNLRRSRHRHRQLQVERIHMQHVSMRSCYALTTN
jgi:hypothetical protein